MSYKRDSKSKVLARWDTLPESPSMLAVTDGDYSPERPSLTPHEQRLLEEKLAQCHLDHLGRRIPRTATCPCDPSKGAHAHSWAAPCTHCSIIQGTNWPFPTGPGASYLPVHRRLTEQTCPGSKTKVPHVLKVGRIYGMPPRGSGTP